MSEEEEKVFIKVIIRIKLEEKIITDITCPILIKPSEIDKLESVMFVQEL